MRWIERGYGCGWDLRCGLFDIGIAPDPCKPTTPWRANVGQLRLKVSFPDADAAKHGALLFVRKELAALAAKLDKLGEETE